MFRYFDILAPQYRNISISKYLNIVFMRILLVEDDAGLADGIIKNLKDERFSVDWVQSGEEGVALGKLSAYDCAVVDLKLAGVMSGLDVCKAVRERGQVYPILMLSGTRDAQMKVKALNLGADDYLTKPFISAELLARIRALLRRERTIASAVITIGDIVLDTLGHTVIFRGKPLPMNRKEFALLEYFMRNHGAVLTRSMILEHVWDSNIDQFTNTVDVHVRFLRGKLRESRRRKLIHTVHGYGYKFELVKKRPRKKPEPPAEQLRESEQLNKPSDNEPAPPANTESAVEPKVGKIFKAHET
jgi:DNA-binding response OmpR family regulator